MSMMALHDSLRADVAAGRVLVIAGAGVSAAISEGAAASSWAGLLEAGLEQVGAVRSDVPDEWKVSVRQDIHLGSQGFDSSFLAAADKITAQLGGRQGGEFRRWLRETVGALQPANPGLGKAVGALGLPVATTNYDTLLEQVMGRPTTSWRDLATTQLALRGEANDLVHLHGYWQDPTSIVFGGQAYGSLLAEGPAQAMQRAIATLKSVLFVGCGAGLDDPNFLALRTWMRELIKDSQVRHYRLCLDSEVSDLRQRHQDEAIVPISYGASHADLIPFLDDLAPETPTTDLASIRPSASERALDALCEVARTSHVLHEHMRDLDIRGIEQLVLPPVLLPMSQEQFSAAQRLERGARPQRCDPVLDVKEHQALLVVGGDGSGLTSALGWLVAESARQRGRIAPLVVDFQRCGAGHNPLLRQVRRELLAAGAVSDPRGDLPSLALGLDNVAARPEKTFDRVIGELDPTGFAFLAVGCRLGQEAAVASALRARGWQIQVRYIGDMRRGDAVELAALVEPLRAELVGRRALELAQREHLRRTPMTISLLISVLLHGEALLGTASETSLLEAYVSLLLGRGDPHDDARVGLDVVARADILGTLAEHYATDRTGSMPESRVIEIFQEYFDALGWSEDPVEVLLNLRQRHVLNIRGGQVGFTQSSYLHLFAAKKAMRSKEFCQAVLAEPLYYAKIVRHYAALTRDDADVLRSVDRLLDGAEGVVGTTRSFQASSEESPLIGLPRVDEPGPKEQPVDPAALEDWMDALTAGDPAPFPADNLLEASRADLMIAAVALVSSVLRDSELVDDLELKSIVLQRSLHAWGKVVSVVEGHEGHMVFVRGIGEEISHSLGVSDARREEFVTDFVEMGPILLGYGGIASTLASRKLGRLLDAAIREDDLLEAPATAVMAGLLSFAIQHESWTEHFATIRQRHGSVPAVNLVLRRMAISAYFSDEVTPQQALALEDFIVSFAIRASDLSPAQEKAQLGRFKQELRSQRNLARQQQKSLPELSGKPLELDL